VARNVILSSEASAVSAMCVGVGTAVSKDAPDVASSMTAPTRRRLRFVFFASSSSVQMPLGPRKSGMPADVEMPAPVRNTIRSAFFASSARRSSFVASARGASSVSGRPVTPLFGYSERRSA